MATRDRMIQARRLIQARQYDDARRVLKTVKHPKAKEWLAKLPRQPHRLRKVLMIAIVILALVIIPLFVNMLQEQSRIADLLRAQW